MDAEFSDKQQADALYRRASPLSGSTHLDIRQAWQYLEAALKLDPGHVDANVLAGDLWVTASDELNPEFSSEQSVAFALPFFEQALRVEPLHADAWSGKSRCLGDLNRHAEALVAAEAGFAVLPLRVGYHWSYDVYRLVAEELYEGKLRALLGLGRHNEVVQTLKEALSRYPGSTYLAELPTELGLFARANAIALEGGNLPSVGE